jgi:CO/xanthine dehydrogenase FAD-binding subunit
MPLVLTKCATAGEASAALSREGARYLGGGTLLVRAVNEGDIATSGYVRTTDPALSGIEISQQKVRIGASTTMSMIARCSELAAISPAAKAVGGPAIRNMATVGGNLFAPAPYGDFTVALQALGAIVHTTGGDMEIDDFLARRDGFGEHGEHGGQRAIVTAVSFGFRAEDSFKFVKVSRIKPKGVSVLSIGAVIERDPQGLVTAARISLGCMADRPMRAAAAEKALIGAPLTRTGIAEAAAVIGADTNPITDPIASAWYRTEVLPVHFSRLLLG